MAHAGETDTNISPAGWHRVGSANFVCRHTQAAGLFDGGLAVGNAAAHVPKPRPPAGHMPRVAGRMRGMPIGRLVALLQKRVLYQEGIVQPLPVAEIFAVEDLAAAAQCRFGDQGIEPRELRCRAQCMCVQHHGR